MSQRAVEIYVAGCPLCDEAVELVRSLACPSCEVQVHDLRGDRAAHARARQQGVRHVPAVVVDGRLAACCQGGGVDAGALRSAGVGTP